jgi:hypothetical protein
MFKATFAVRRPSDAEAAALLPAFERVLDRLQDVLTEGAPNTSPANSPPSGAMEPYEDRTLCTREYGASGRRRRQH